MAAERRKFCGKNKAVEWSWVRSDCRDGLIPLLTGELGVCEQWDFVCEEYGIV